MSKLVRLVCLTLFFSAVPLTAFAEEGAKWDSGLGLGLAVGAGLAVGLAGLGCGIGQGLTAGNTTAGIARNPGAAGTMFTNFIIAMALIESISIYGLVIAMMLFFRISGLE
jgi:F-type H+-transporting ATPase subunit c